MRNLSNEKRHYSLLDQSPIQLLLILLLANCLAR